MRTTRPTRRLAGATLALLLGLGSLAVLADPAAAATTRHLSPTGSNQGDCTVAPCRSLSYAISQADDGDTIQLAAGDYPEGADANDKSLTIQGAGSDVTTVGGPTAQFGLFVHAVGKTIDISDLRFAGSGAVLPNTFGGGLQVMAGTVRLERVAIVGNRAEYGGGVYVAPDGRLEAEDSEIRDNEARAGGGFDVRGEARFEDMIVSGNSAEVVGGGGAVEFEHDLDLIGGEITGNEAGPSGGPGGLWVGGTAGVVGTTIADNVGGGIVVTTTGTLDLTDSVVRGNTTPNNGAGLFNAGVTRIADSRFTGNVTGQHGGAIGNGGGIGFSSLQVDRTTIDHNQATGNGGAVYSLIPASIRTSTISDNVAGGFGAVVSGHALTLVDSTVAGNSGSAGAGGLVTIPPDDDSRITVATSIVASNAGGNCSGDITDAGYNLTTASAPLTCPFVSHAVFADPQLAPLADVGDGVFARTPALTSPALDAGPSSEIVVPDLALGTTISLCGPTAVDQREAPRRIGSACDIGAIEVAAPPTLTGPATASVVEGDALDVQFAATGQPKPTVTAAGALPAGVTFTAVNGIAHLAGTPTLGSAGTYPITLTAKNGLAPDATLSFTLTVIPALAVTTTALPGGSVGSPYSAALAATGGIPARTWDLAAGSLPAGLTLSAGGVISGIPTGPAATTTFTVRVTDSATPSHTATRQLSITIARRITTLTAEPAVLQLSLGGIKLTLVNVAATLRAAPNATPQAGQPVTFTVGSTVLCTALTNAAGRASCPPVGVGGVLGVLLMFGYRASFDGTPSLAPSTDTAGLIG